VDAQTVLPTVAAVVFVIPTAIIFDVYRDEEDEQ
jgi:hypothetical protein